MPTQVPKKVPRHLQERLASSDAPGDKAVPVRPRRQNGGPALGFSLSQAGHTLNQLAFFSKWKGDISRSHGAWLNSLFPLETQQPKMPREFPFYPRHTQIWNLVSGLMKTHSRLATEAKTNARVQVLSCNEEV